MGISHKPGINNWNNGRHRNMYTVTKDIKHNQPIKVEEQPQPQIEETPKIIEEPKSEVKINKTKTDEPKTGI